MAELKNYYELLQLNQSDSCETLSAQLRKQKKIWINRQNAASQSSRQKAEQMVPLIEEALVTLSDPAKRKEYDKSLNKQQKRSGGSAQRQGQQAQPQYNEPPVSNPNGANIQFILQQIQNIYDAGNTEETIQICKRYLNMGYNNSEIYKYLGQAYNDAGDVKMAVAEFKNGLMLNPNDADFYVNLAVAYLFNAEDPAQAEPYLNQAMQMYPGNSYIMALNVYKLMLEGKLEQADQIVNNYMSIHPEDKMYRQYVSNMYVSYSYHYFSTASNGAYYIDTQEDYNSRLNMLKRAQEISANENTNASYAEMADLGKKSLYHDKNAIWAYILACLVSVSALSVAFDEDGAIVLAILLIAATVALFYFNVQPKWKLLKMEVTGKKETPCAIAYWFGRIGKWALFVFVIIAGFVVGMLGSGN